MNRALHSDPRPCPPSPQKKKDPNAPKRGLSAYMFFCQEQRQALKQEKPDMKVTEITSELGKRWRALPEEDKKKVGGEVSCWRGWGVLGCWHSVKLACCTLNLCDQSLRRLVLIDLCPRLFAFL